MGRKVTRGVDPPEVEGYQWDGWKLIMIAKLNTDGTFHSRKWSCVWRPDVGSSLYARSDWMRAGGVGGVAWLQTGAVQSYSYGTGGAEVHVPLADHMGNVRHYYQFKSTKGNVTGQLVASYEYDAFGREVRAWGLNTPTENQPPGLPASRPWADLLPFHYSSKLRDVDSGFNYYGYRFYDPGAGRWLNRDPIEEEGGVNLYGMLLNDPLNWIDVLGMSKPSCEEFEKYYPKFIYKNGGVSTDRVYDDVGGWVDGAHDNSINKARGAYQDSCALRASIALNGCGGPHKIPTSGGRGDGINRVPDGKKPKDNVILSAERMCAYLEKQFGKPDYEGDAGFIQMQANSDKACGCFCFVSCSDAHVAFTGIRGEPDSIPTNGKNGKAKGWKLPCKNHGNQ